MQNKDTLRPLVEPLLAEARGLLATEPGVEERTGTLLRIAQAWDTLGQPDKGRATRAEAVALVRAQPTNAVGMSPLLWPTLALAHSDAGDSAGAKALYAEGVPRAQKQPTAEARFYALAWLALYQASPKNALAAKATMALAVKANPTLAESAPGLSLQTTLLVEVGEYASAKKRLLATTRDAPNTALALGNLATKQAKAGDRAGAKRTLSEAVKRSQLAKSPLERQMTQELLLRYFVQIGEGDTAKKRAGTDPKARKAVAEALAEQGDAESARQLSEEPSSALVFALAAKGKIAEAQKEASRLLEDPGSFSMQDDPLRLLGAIAAAQAKSGDTAGANATLEQARKRITDDKTFGDKRLMLLGSLIESIVTGGKRPR